MIKVIKKYFRKKTLVSYLSKHKSVRRYRSDDDIRRILILFDGTDITKYGRMNAIVKRLKNEGKDVTCLAYFDKKELDDICLTQNNIQFISKDEFDWIGLPEKAFIEEYIQYQYNLCMNLSLFYSEQVEVLFKLADAELKAGKNFGMKTLADFMIDVNDDTDETFLADQIKYYLRNVKSNGR